MGKHLQSLDEQAHRGEREDARERRSNRKGKKDRKRGGAADEDEAAPPAAAAANLGGSDKLDLHLEADASETKFEHDGDGGDDGGEAPPPPSLPSPDDVKSRMDRVVSATSESFRSVRGSEPTPELFDSIPVRAYGTLAPLSSVAQVVIQGPTRALLSCFDPETAGAVRDAVRDSGMGFNPRIDETGGTVEVPIPKVSMETRLSLVKQLGKAAEAARQRIRRIRRAAQDVVKKGKDGKLDGVSKDDAFRVAKEIDAVTEKAIEELNDAYERKKDDVMAV